MLPAPAAASARLALALFILLSGLPLHAEPRTQTAADPADGIALVLQRIEGALRSADPEAYRALLAPALREEPATRDFVNLNIVAGATDALVRESDRVALRGVPASQGYRLVIEVFIRRGRAAQVGTWRLDLRRTADAVESETAWQIVDHERLTAVDGLYQLELNRNRQFAVEDLTFRAEDLTLHLRRGLVFTANTDYGVTAVVLMGDGEMEFAPAPEAERVQARIFSGDEVVRSRFESAYLRFNPDDFEERFSGGPMIERPINPRDFNRAKEIFDRELPNSFRLDLGSLSRDLWSVMPSLGDVLAEIRTRRFGTLTYVRSGADPEDIRLFDRQKKRNLAVYPSERKLAMRGRFYAEDDYTDYDILDYNLDVSIVPRREWIQGRATLRVRAKKNLVSMSVRLADALVVRSVSSQPFGRLLPLRALGQDSVILNFPTAIPRDYVFNVTLDYSGHMPGQRPELEALAMQEGPFIGTSITLSPEPHYLYSNRSYWYPQSLVTDYATATLRLTVPAGYECVSSGQLARGTPQIVTGTGDETEGGKRYTYVASQPVRYLALLVSRFTTVQEVLVTVAPGVVGGDGDDPVERTAGVYYDALALTVEANPRQIRRGTELSERAADIVRFFSSLVDDLPYPSFTLALVEKDVPGGHSPAYFAMLNQQLPTSPFTWRNDPVHFDGFPDFFLAHEIAHQWWGQAVGWNNYHEQWLSEGFAQYFATLYAQHLDGDARLAEVLRRMRRWAFEYSDQGPIYLGYRLGHIEGQSRVFRALVYNKSALVLHMLRRLVGDEAFFRGLRRFYTEWRFKKAGTEDLRLAMEAEAGVSLVRFFEGWIYQATLPTLDVTWRLDQAQSQSGTEETVLLTIRQRAEVFDLALTVTLTYDNGASTEVLVKVTEPATVLRIPLAGTLRNLDVNRDYGALARTFLNGREVNR